MFESDFERLMPLLRYYQHAPLDAPWQAWQTRSLTWLRNQARYQRLPVNSYQEPLSLGGSVGQSSLLMLRLVVESLHALSLGNHVDALTMLARVFELPGQVDPFYGEAYSLGMQLARAQNNDALYQQFTARYQESRRNVGLLRGVQGLMGAMDPEVAEELAELIEFRTPPEPASQGAASQDPASQDPVSQGAASHDNDDGDNSNGNSFATRDAAGNNTAVNDTVSNNASLDDTSLDDTSLDDTSLDDISLNNTATDNPQVSDTRVAIDSAGDAAIDDTGRAYKDSLNPEGVTTSITTSSNALMHPDDTEYFEEGLLMPPIAGPGSYDTISAVDHIKVKVSVFCSAPAKVLEFSAAISGDLYCSMQRRVLTLDVMFEPYKPAEMLLLEAREHIRGVRLLNKTQPPLTFNRRQILAREGSGARLRLELRTPVAWTELEGLFDGPAFWQQLAQIVILL
ncbi:MAG: hypothetical protein AAF267_22190 [Deinococcota bacterium]